MLDIQNTFKKQSHEIIYYKEKFLLQSADKRLQDKKITAS